MTTGDHHGQELALSFFTGPIKELRRGCGGGKYFLDNHMACKGRKKSGLLRAVRGSGANHCLTRGCLMRSLVPFNQAKYQSETFRAIKSARSQEARALLPRQVAGQWTG